MGWGKPFRRTTQSVKSFVSDPTRLALAAYTGGNSEKLRTLYNKGMHYGSKAIGYGGQKYHPTNNIYENKVQSYGRPQTSIAMNQAENVQNTLAPTRADWNADGGQGITKYKRSSMGGHYNVDPYAQVQSQLQDPSMGWTDTNGILAGGKQAYRYAWEQPGFQPQNQNYTPALTPAETNVVQQAPPKFGGFDFTDGAMPAMNTASTEGMGFGSDASATGSMGGGTPININMGGSGNSGTSTSTPAPAPVPMQPPTARCL